MSYLCQCMTFFIDADVCFIFRKWLQLAYIKQRGTSNEKRYTMG